MEGETVIIEAHAEFMPESFCTTVYDTGKQEPEADHEYDPQQRTYEKRRLRDLLKRIEQKGSQCKYVYQYDHNFYFWATDEVITQCL